MKLVRSIRSLAFLVMSVALVACGSSNNPDDPFESINRPIHTFNKTVDSIVLRPVARGYDAIVDDEIKGRISNVSSNLGEPSNFVNHVLQGEGHAASVNFTRFILNSTFGVVGLGDPASGMALFPQPTNVGQTLAAWGAPEGPYVELPLLGPSTVRGAFGTVVGMQYDPLREFIPEDDIKHFNNFTILSRINDRARYGDLIEIVLYQSADSYSASRLAYLQNLRSKTNQAEEESDTVELENFYE